MKERPILMKGPMVRAVLAGTKTQTRRAVKPQPPAHVTGIHELRRGTTTGSFPLGCWEWLREDQPSGVEGVRCPYGQPGDRLWVRETWNVMTHDGGKRTFFYRADEDDPDWHGLKWNPSIHMPREASRLTLEITEVRVERLNDISEEDAKAEGIKGYPFRPDDGFPICTGYTHRNDDGKCALHPTPSKAFADLWESINGPGSWAANPWVWVVSFRRLP